MSDELLLIPRNELITVYVSEQNFFYGMGKALLFHDIYGWCIKSSGRFFSFGYKMKTKKTITISNRDIGIALGWKEKKNPDTGGYYWLDSKGKRFGGDTLNWLYSVDLLIEEIEKLKLPYEIYGPFHGCFANVRVGNSEAVGKTTSGALAIALFQYLQSKKKRK